MKAITRSDHTDNIIGEREDGNGDTILQGVGNLSAKVHTTQYGKTFTSHWQPDEDDLALLGQGGVIELDVIGEVLSPVRVSVTPAEPGADVEPTFRIPTPEQMEGMREEAKTDRETSQRLEEIEDELSAAQGVGL
jgi:hypothetical protein